MNYSAAVYAVLMTNEIPLRGTTETAVIWPEAYFHSLGLSKIWESGFNEKIQE